MMRRALVTIATSIAVALLAAASGCVKNERAELTHFPDQNQFIQVNGVSQMMEARCGAIDCHGQVGRPLRIYSKNGLRYRPGDGGGLLRDPSDTTREERIENYFSVVGLEPDALGDAVRTRGEYIDFQLLLKPLDIAGRGVRHKGGPVLAATRTDPGWLCLWGWIAGDFDERACAAATF